jgi:hypothetical protein
MQWISDEIRLAPEHQALMPPSIAEVMFPQITCEENGGNALLSLRSLMRGILNALPISTGPLAGLGPILAGTATADTAGMLLNLGQCRIKGGMRTLSNPGHCHERVTLRVDGERLRSGLPDIPHGATEEINQLPCAPIGSRLHTQIHGISPL